MSYKDMMEKTKIDLFMDTKNTFLMHVIFSHQFIESTEHQTAATDGENFFINEDFFISLASDKHRASLLKHEAWHTVFKHPIRGIGKDAEIWGMAVDYFVNNLLVKDKDPLPTPNGLYDSKYDGWTEEEIYNDLLQSGQSPESDPFNGNDVIQPTSEDQTKALEQKLEQTLLTATMQAEMAKDIGSIPSHIKREMDALRNPKLPWFTLLQDFMFAQAKTDYSWARPHRRYLAHDMYLPSEIGEGLGKLHCYNDASGSVSDKEFDAYRSEIQEIIKSLKPEETKVFSFDTELSEPTTLLEGDSVESIKFSGYGGTAIEPVIDNIIKEKPDVAVIFTDGEFHKYQEQVAAQIITPIIWVIVGNPNWKTTVGTVVHMEL